MIQRCFSKLGIFCFFFLLPLAVNAQRGEKITTVVIDAGHGGKDPGAIGKKCKEKDINLAVALKTGEYIKQNLPDVVVKYTRSTDVFIPLNERAQIANRNNADVFISIHCNATKNTAVSGTETFVMGEHKNEANLEVAKLENSAILYEENADEEYGGFDLDSPEAYIALTLLQSEYQNRSLEIAGNAQKQFTERVGRKSRGVQQAGFLVLVRTTMPSILIELGFLTNPAEEDFLVSDAGQVYMSSAIFRAFRDFKVAYEKENNVVAAPKESEEQQELDSIAFKVQFASKDKKVAITDKMFKKIDKVWMYQQDKSYKYTSGCFGNREEAVRHQAKMREMGYKDAFVVAFKNGERVTVKEAEECLSKRK